MEFSTIIGAAIAIVSSSVTALLTYFFQTREANKKRNWEIEDKKKEIKRGIAYQRLEELENFLKDFGRRISTLQHLLQPDTTLEEILLENQADRFQNWHENLYLLSLLQYFYDEELVGHVENLVSKITEVNNVYKEYSEKLKSGEPFDRSKYTDRKFEPSTALLYSNVIARIDHLKEQYIG